MEILRKTALVSWTTKSTPLPPSLSHALYLPPSISLSPSLFLSLPLSLASSLYISLSCTHSLSLPHSISFSPSHSTSFFPSPYLATSLSLSLSPLTLFPAGHCFLRVQSQSLWLIKYFIYGRLNMSLCDSMHRTPQQRPTVTPGLCCCSPPRPLPHTLTLWLGHGGWGPHSLGWVMGSITQTLEHRSALSSEETPMDTNHSTTQTLPLPAPDRSSSDST